MSVPTKARPIKRHDYINVKVGIPGRKEISYHIPKSQINNLNSFLKKLDVSKSEITPWEEATPWEELAKERIAKYKKAGIVLRGARYRENLSQVQLAKLSGIHQNEISKIENGKRTVGEKVAKRLAKCLNISYQMLLDEEGNDKSEVRKIK
jgi:ribosome-binding protein aMBF1 (putative translation factor)